MSGPIKAQRQSGEHLWLKLYTRESLLNAELLDQPHRDLRDLAPGWCAELMVVKDERDRKGLSVANQTLLQALEKSKPIRWSLGSWTLRGSNPGILLFIKGARAMHAPELNVISLELFRITTFEESDASSWLCKAFRRLVSRLPIRYANAHANAEFDASNLERGPDSVRAIGVSLHRCLPGRYWLNFFGPEYLDLIGRARLLGAPAHAVEPAGDGVFLSLGEAVSTWKTSVYQHRREAVYGTHVMWVFRKFGEVASRCC